MLETGGEVVRGGRQCLYDDGGGSQTRSQQQQRQQQAGTRLQGVGGRDGHRRRSRPLRHRLPMRVCWLGDGSRGALLQHLQALCRGQRGGSVLQAHGPQLHCQRVQAGLRRQPTLVAAAAIHRLLLRGAGLRGRRGGRAHRSLLYAGCHHCSHRGHSCRRLDAVLLLLRLHGATQRREGRCRGAGVRRKDQRRIKEGSRRERLWYSRTSKQ